MAAQIVQAEHVPPSSPDVSRPVAAGDLRKQLLDILERSAFTAIQALAAVYLAKGVLSISGVEVAVLTAVATVLTAVRTLISQHTGNTRKPKNWIEDLSSRTAFTFAATLVASLITAASTPLDMSALKSSLVAALAASLAVVKASVARGVDGQNSASIVSGV